MTDRGSRLGGAVPGVPRADPGAGEPTRPGAVAGRPQTSRPSGVQAGRRRSDRDRLGAGQSQRGDPEQARALAGIVAVDRAVRHGRANHPPLRVSRLVAERLGWPVCPACDRGIQTGGGVSYHAELLHPECVAELLVAA